LQILLLLAQVQLLLDLYAQWFGYFVEVANYAPKLPNALGWQKFLPYLFFYPREKRFKNAIFIARSGGYSD
jgi:hypothetical protein